jgi:D-alanyl-D-alanine carboxypeptidase (penicillin-binding protein 5/6)
MLRLLRDPSLYFLALLLVMFLTYPGYSYYRYINPYTHQPSFRDLPVWFSDVPLAPYPVKVGKQEVATYSAEAIFAVDVASAVPIYAKNEHQALSPASTTKIMTALISIEEYNLDDVLTVSQASFSGSLMKLQSGDKVTVRTLLYGLLINSGNDAADVLALHYPTGYEGFLKRMNDRAIELGLRETHFSNASGLPAPHHVMSAWDLGQLAAYALRNDLFRKIVSTKETTVYGVHGQKYVLKSTNKLLNEVNGLDGVKTGYTEEAGEVFVSTVQRKEHRIVTVVLKSNDRFGESKSLIEWGFRNFEWRVIPR